MPVPRRCGSGAVGVPAFEKCFCSSCSAMRALAEQESEPTVTRSEMEAALTDEVLDDIAKALGVYRRRRDKSKGATAILNAVFGETT